MLFECRVVRSSWGSVWVGREIYAPAISGKTPLSPPVCSQCFQKLGRDLEVDLKMEWDVICAEFLAACLQACKCLYGNFELELKKEFHYKQMSHHGSQSFKQMKQTNANPSHPMCRFWPSPEKGRPPPGSGKKC